ncbi:uncharacterized protein PHACADRAFT_138571 [Phanerochaete carnosa HHB-10118-sp]|uniref:AB hydrolase-1 domain-containing protein n=1 Tax=Phanerochaete carnosa (strain HHB-10118-sp) TaxID=650164 RepID=K5XB29_PHACS|nr:uncharacterized protein PHACADRAFT_138571 [Phanerochaete carnosa HHB-10118-sp]EKM60147.1 hypothetical protein PHACADRAFT_138571 [Phanerochaete carnosa HHB-10118-sp]
MPSSASFQCVTLTLLILPAIVLALYFLTSFPHAPDALLVNPSLASLPKHIRSWHIYPEDVYSGGAYVSFPPGRTRYWLLGPEDGIKIVLIHGLSVPSLIWKEVAPHLAERGFHVLLYDLYGRGYSDAPQTTYDVSLYTTQLALLLQYIGWDSTNLCGVSMGGGIAAAFAVQFPHLVQGDVALIATTGVVDAADLSRTSRFLSSPVMQFITASAPFRMYLRHLASNASRIDNACDELVRIQSAHLPGYNPAIASSIRDGPIRALAPVFAQLGRQMRKRAKGAAGGGRVLLVWGTRDSVVPYQYAARVRSLIGDESASMVTLDDAGHDLTVTRGDDIVQELVAFFGNEGAKE